MSWLDISNTTSQRKLKYIFGMFCSMFIICWVLRCIDMLGVISYYCRDLISNLCEICETALKDQNPSWSVVIGCTSSVQVYTIILFWKELKMKSNLEEGRKEKKSHDDNFSFPFKTAPPPGKSSGKGYANANSEDYRGIQFLR